MTSWKCTAVRAKRVSMAVVVAVELHEGHTLQQARCTGGDILDQHLPSSVDDQAVER